MIDNKRGYYCLIDASKGTVYALCTRTDIHLDSEENDAVPVYDTCNMIRCKIDQHLKKPGIFLEETVCGVEGVPRILPLS